MIENSGLTVSDFKVGMVLIEKLGHFIREV